MLKPLAEAQAGQQPDKALMKKDSITSDDIADAWQDLLRWAGNLPAAKKAAARWQAARGDSSALPALRLGEIDFLMHDYNDAAAEFGLAARRFSLAGDANTLQFSQAELDRGAALLAVGRTAEAVQSARPLDLRGTQGDTRAPTPRWSSPPYLSTHASSSGTTRANQATCVPPWRTTQARWIGCRK